jgi:hypothetical protein
MTGVEFAISQGARSAQIAQEINSVITMLPRETGDYLIRALNQGVMPVGANTVPLRMSPEQAAHVFCDELVRMRDIANQRINPTNQQESVAALALSRFNTPEGIDRFVRRETNMLREMAGEVRINPPARVNEFSGSPQQIQAQLERELGGAVGVRGRFNSPQEPQRTVVAEETRIVAGAPSQETNASQALERMQRIATNYGIRMERNEDPTVTFLHTRERLVGYIQSMESGMLQIDGRNVAINEASPTQIPPDFQRILRRYGGNTQTGIEALRDDLRSLDENFRELRRENTPAERGARVVNPVREETITFENPTEVRGTRRPTIQAEPTRQERPEREINLPDANVTLNEPQLGSSRRQRRSILDMPEPETRIEPPIEPVVQRPVVPQTRPVERPTEVVLPVTEIRATRPREPERVPEPVETRLEPTIITGTRRRETPQVEATPQEQPTRVAAAPRTLSPRDRRAAHDAATAVTRSQERIDELTTRINERLGEIERGNPTPDLVRRVETQLRLYTTQVNAARSAVERNLRALERFDETRFDQELRGEVTQAKAAVIPTVQSVEELRRRATAVRERIARVQPTSAPTQTQPTARATTLAVQGAELERTRERSGQNPGAYSLTITPATRGGIDVQLPLRFRSGVEDNAPVAADVNLTITLQDLARDGGYARIYAAISRAWRVIGRDSGAGVIPFMPDRSFNMTLRNALTAMSRGVRGPDAEVFRNAIAGIPAPQALRRTADGAIDLSQY